MNRVKVILAVLVAIVLGWTSQTEFFSIDMTRDNKNSLSATTINILTTIPETITVTAFVTQSKKGESANTRVVRAKIKQFIRKFQRHKKNISLDFVNHADQLDLAKKYGVIATQEVILELGGRHKKLRFLDEESFANSLLQLVYKKDIWIVFSEGHAEKNIFNNNRQGYSQLVEHLKKRNFHVQALDLAKTGSIPKNTSVFVIAGARRDFQEKEVTLIKSYLDSGGNLLWLYDPGTKKRLSGLASRLGIRFLPGVIVSHSNNKKPTLYVQPRFSGSRHPVAANLNGFHALFPISAGLKIIKQPQLAVTSIVNSAITDWNETNLNSKNNAGSLKYDSGSADSRGPLSIAVAIEAPKRENKPMQRIIVTGDSDFLSNEHLYLGANRFLGVNMFNWLSYHERLNTILRPQKLGTNSFRLSNSGKNIFAFIFILLIPGVFSVAGFYRWRSRNKQ